MIKKLIILIMFITFLAPTVYGAAAYSASFNPLDSTCDELSATERSNSEVCQEADDARASSDPVNGTDGIIIKVANILSVVAGIIAVIIVIIAGITMMLSSGDSAKVQSSRNAIIYAVVGAAVIVLARSIIIFVINQTG